MVKHEKYGELPHRVIVTFVANDREKRHEGVSRSAVSGSASQLVSRSASQPVS
ncbi:MAG: hypothetical protein IPL78_11665 [Chloroflexi bacterium]|nr:hypothetical protein [Chloroflexota bacterium]